MKIEIDQEFKSLIPTISEDELSGLEQSLLADGCRDELVVWGNTILDGHNRFSICEKHGIKYLVRYMDFPGRDAAKLWIICNQLSRRNLSTEQISYLRGLRYQIEKKDGGRPVNKPLQNEEDTGETRKRLAREFNVSPSTIERDAKFAEAVDKLPPEEKKEVLSGKSGKSKKEIVGEKKKEWVVPKNQKLKPPSNGMQFARMAIMDLEKIEENDAQREEAFMLIYEWLENNKHRGDKNERAA